MGAQPTPVAIPASQTTGLPSLDKMPRHVAIVMDGNGRWAKSRGLPRLAGHRAGTENLRRIIEACHDFGIKYLTVYAFSTENWNRPPAEVTGLLLIIEDVIDRELENLHKNNVRLVHLGRKTGLNEHLQRKIAHAVNLTQQNTGLTLNIAFNYGGRDEVVYAIQSIIRLGVPAEAVTEALVSAHLFTAGQPDPDLVVRTSGEMRISNFLIWQSSYAEWYVTSRYWPDFDREALRQAVWFYADRERRFGKVSEQVKR